MSRLRPLAVASAVVVTEVLLTVGGSELWYQAALSGADISSIARTLLFSVSVPWSAPWHGAWAFNGLSTTVGVIVFVLLAGLMVAGICRGTRAERPFLTVFLGTWGALAVALSLSYIVRYLIGTREAEAIRPGGDFADAALTVEPVVHHAVYVGWVVALIAAAVAAGSRVRDTPTGAPSVLGGPVTEARYRPPYSPQYWPPLGGGEGAERQYGSAFTPQEAPPFAPAKSPGPSPSAETVAIPDQQDPPSSGSA